MEELEGLITQLEGVQHELLLVPKGSVERQALQAKADALDARITKRQAAFKRHQRSWVGAVNKIQACYIRNNY